MTGPIKKFLSLNSVNSTGLKGKNRLNNCILNLTKDRMKDNIHLQESGNDLLTKNKICMKSKII